MTEHVPDEALLARHAAGDPYAFPTLVQRHMDHLWAVAVTTLADYEDAADALQDALLRIHRGAETFRGESALATWMHRVVVNVSIDRLRQRAARPTVPLVVDVMRTTPDPMAAVERRIDVAAALAQLPQEQRVAVTLVDLHGMPIKDSAELLGIPEGTIKSRCFRGRMTLARLLAHMVNEESGAEGNQSGSGLVQSEQPSSSTVTGGGSV